jgi:cobyrinic acid a,c-diamide synthase
VLTLGPRLVIAGTHSGVGKTTVATSLMAAFSAQGLRVASAKVGPDYIDPSYHRLATGRPGCSLDAWLSGEELLGPLAASASTGADLLVVEGVMGLFDGSAQPGCNGSTAEVARLLHAPVVLVVDASAMSGSVAAVVHGFASLNPRVRLAGVILNRVAGESHAELLRDALDPLGIPIAGVLSNDAALGWRERHLGLVPVAEHPADVRRSLKLAAEATGRRCDLAMLLALARSAPATSVPAPPEARRVTDRGGVRVAVAAGAAFSFTYPENLALLAQAGAELVAFDPVRESSLPEGCTGLYAGGGFPEVFAAELAGNRPLLADVRARVAGGLVTWAECGGLLWLSRSLDGTPMAGVIPADGHMDGRLAIGYRTARTRVPTPLGPAGLTLRGHEFHRSVLDPPGDALSLSGRFGSGLGGFVSPQMFASYLHQHLSASPQVAESFVAAVASCAP